MVWGAVLAQNDLHDLPSDRDNPRKATAPLVIGAVSAARLRTWYRAMALAALFVGPLFVLGVAGVLLLVGRTARRTRGRAGSCHAAPRGWRRGRRRSRWHEAFESSRAEALTMLPTIRSFMDAHRLPDVTIVADAGMISAANQKAIEDAGLSFIFGARIPDVPYVVAEWRSEHPGRDIGDGQVFVQPWPAGPADKRRDQVIYYQYKADRARRTRRGIDEQVAKAERPSPG